MTSWRRGFGWPGRLRQSKKVSDHRVAPSACGVSPTEIMFLPIRPILAIYQDLSAGHEWQRKLFSWPAPGTTSLFGRRALAASRLTRRSSGRTIPLNAVKCRPARPMRWVQQRNVSPRTWKGVLHAGTCPVSPRHRTTGPVHRGNAAQCNRRSALAKLRDGIPTRTMLTASALAVTRSADLPPGHHGGPLHPLAGLYALSKLVDRLRRRGPLPPCAAARCAGQQAHQRPGDRRRSACWTSRRWMPTACRSAAWPISPRTAPVTVDDGEASRRPRRPSSRRAAAAKATRPTTCSSGCGTMSQRSRRSTC